MSSMGGNTPPTARNSAYNTNAMEKIKNELQPFANVGAAHQQQQQQQNQQQQNHRFQELRQTLLAAGFPEELALKALKASNGNPEDAFNYLKSGRNGEYILNGHAGKLPGYVPRLMRKQSIEREVPLTSMHLPRQSPAMDSGAGSSRSDSPHQQYSTSNRASSVSQYSPSPCPSHSSYNDVVPPTPPPRCPSTPSTPPPPFQMGHMLKRMSPATGPSRQMPTIQSQSPARGTSPVATNSRQPPIIVQNGPQAQQQLNHAMQTLSMYTNGGNVVEPPPPYPILPNSSVNAPPSYIASIQNRQSPTHSSQDYRKSPSSGIYSGTSAGSPSPITVTQNVGPTHVSISRPIALQPQPFSARQTKTQQPIIMHSVKSTQVQKPVLQTAIAPPTPIVCVSPPVLTSAAPPSYATSIQQKHQQSTTPPLLQLNSAKSSPSSSVTPPSTPNNVTTPLTTFAVSVNNAVNAANAGNTSPGAHLTNDPPPYPTILNMRQRNLPPPPPYSTAGSTTPSNNSNYASSNQSETSSNYSSKSTNSNMASFNSVIANTNLSTTPPLPPSNVHGAGTSSANVANNNNGTNSRINSHKEGNNNNNHLKPTMNGTTKSQNATSSNNNNNNNVASSSSCKKVKLQSPIPERKHLSKEKEEEKSECKVKHYSPQAYKFFMEQHVENVMKSYKQRNFRRTQLELEMSKMKLPEETKGEMRKLLFQKESNYIRLKRAKMDKSMFAHIKKIGKGAFGEVILVRKIDTSNHLYAMKTLRKSDVLERNQVAHVKAERDILAEADNEWVVKLYYSFQDKDNLYFVMDYIPGGDLMSLLIKKGIFEENLARFYIAELTLAIESVHKMGFIHRDIKPDNILIDKKGHIKLTDFGLCTGFRWTHDSKYYQKNGEHARQDSMEAWSKSGHDHAPIPPPLERRKYRDKTRSKAHSIVGTPNYIAPEVLLRSGYTQLCDWWSVGVILYEMLVGQPPFLANTAEETQYKVIHWRSTLKIPPQAKLTEEASNLIIRLCCSEDERLGKQVDEIKTHPFLRQIDWSKDLRSQKAPYEPKIKYPTDTSNFDDIDHDGMKDSSDTDHAFDDLIEGGKPFHHGFFEFTFRRFFDDDNKISLDVANDNQSGAIYV
ncbi:serine/threonine-protein kinase Warts isoform X2 [Culicoides brevitarsis]|uniref:serine/threonine-protein kinase Warts isoform X2 n=1 Tax=Culicoides brevitarsis TaxID=469753 RepID=UPI00307B1207